jgi:hypothetical protein
MGHSKNLRPLIFAIWVIASLWFTWDLILASRYLWIGGTI